MGFLEELDVAGAEDNVWAIPSDWYHMTITEDELVDKKGQEEVPEDQRVKNWRVTFTINQGEYADEELRSFFVLPNPVRKDGETVMERKNGQWLPETRDNKKSRTRLKNFLTALEIPVERMNSIETGDLTGTEVYAYAEQNGQFTNVSMREGNIRLDNGTASVDSSNPSDDALSVFRAN